MSENKNNTINLRISKKKYMLSQDYHKSFYMTSKTIQNLDRG